ncbi:carboxymuconolactone decarboxylase family protein [Mycolicibacterium confluentis]|nr:carboxymuconolactone decarboxylase family protein [Mycolicibacterium confluentis]MCV7321897.1 carboxymuconolactone decarboxylase family protein [Mycolicibacterium confluentis]ORV32152.1 carboxymuconolactone decarboxylase [Mycolicibacterium confluentis]
MGLGPLPADEWDDRARESLASLVAPEHRHPDGAGNALATMVRHPDLAAAYLPFGVHLLERSTLPPRMRELVTLRVAHNTGCAYEWAHHVHMGAQVGITDEDIVALRRGAAHDEFDRALIAAVDELQQYWGLSPATWEALGERLDDQQRMDLIFTVGGYTTFAMGLNSFGVRPEQQAVDAAH